MPFIMGGVAGLLCSIIPVIIAYKFGKFKNPGSAALTIIVIGVLAGCAGGIILAGPVALIAILVILLLRNK